MYHYYIFRRCYSRGHSRFSVCDLFCKLGEFVFCTILVGDKGVNGGYIAVGLGCPGMCGRGWGVTN
jgi:hypothetical protein